MDQYGACWGGHYNLSSKDFPPTIDHHRSTPKSPTGLTVHLAHINEHQPFLRRGKGKSLDAQCCPLEEETELHQPHMHQIVQSPTKTFSHQLRTDVPNKRLRRRRHRFIPPERDSILNVSSH